MRKIVKMLGVGALLIAVSAPSAVFAKELKIGMVDYRRIMATSDEAKAVMEKMQKEFKPKQEKLIALETMLKEKSEKLQRNAAIMSDVEKSKLERDVVSAQRDMQRLQEEFREDTIARQQEETQKLFEKVSNVVKSLAEKEQYDLILHQDVNIYAADHINITEKVIKAMKSAS